MGVSIDAGGGRRRMEFEVNVVPFLDLLSVCITFLLATAVWTTMDSIAVDQIVGSETTESAPPAVLRIGKSGLSFGRGTAVAALAGWPEAEAAMADDRERHPDEPALVLVTDDGVEYGSMIRGLDHAKSLGYTVSLGAP